eukprot:c7620_g1_i1.p1 GENE.c7620_g1_i1~~c7620_g1_i1.p1  ORF type:complete len:540 (+),score=142.31 c7620_g1_i1:127-1620(+)
MAQNYDQHVRRRVRCDCMATQHALVTNCLGCGRIVCEEEGKGPCVFCGTLVAMTTDEAQNQIKQALRLSTKQGGPDAQQNLQNAINLKDKMLQYQRESAQRTAVFDDQADWFASDSNRWLSEEERKQLKTVEEEMLRQREERLSRSSRKIKVTFDLAGRRVIEEQALATDEIRTLATAQQNILDSARDSRAAAVASANKKPSGKAQTTADPLGGGSGFFVNDSINGPLPIFQSSQPNTSSNTSNNLDGSLLHRTNLRVQHSSLADKVFWGELPATAAQADVNIALDDTDYDNLENSMEYINPSPSATPSSSSAATARNDALFESDAGFNIAKANKLDKGMCLSMHQPWASLFVYGIKRVEGRVWPTEHRGRLWIASTVKEPSADEIRQMEDFYRTFYGDNSKHAVFPAHYPTGSLLGCVEIVDCLDTEQFKATVPPWCQDESDSPFVFVGATRHRMLLPIPIQGKHKLWKLEARVLDAAQTALKLVPRVCVPPNKPQ